MKLLRQGVYACSILVPLVLLFDLTSVFYFDWGNNLWLTAYYGEYLRHHLSLPVTVNTVPSIGSPLPLFYGYLFYPAVAALSAAVGSALAIRIALLLLAVFQFYALLAAGARTFRHRGVSTLVAVSVLWSTYSLTNLYNRSDITEYFATNLLVSCVAFVVAAASEPSRRERRFFGWAAFVSALVAAGTHPPTAVLAAPLLLLICAPLALGALRSRREVRWAHWAPVGAFACLGALILSPWVYATLRMRERLVVIRDWKSAPMTYFPDRCDSFIERFCPFPYDAGSTLQGTAKVSTPYLEAPVIFGLVILLAWNLALLARRRGEAPPEAAGPTRWEGASGWILAAALAWFALMTALSLSPSLAGLSLFRELGPMIQFAYRLVSHCNAALLAAVFASGALVVRRGGYLRHGQATRIVVAIGLVVALEGVAIKLQHADAITVHPDLADYALHGDRSWLVTYGNFSLDWPYSTPDFVKALPDETAQGAPWAIFPVGARGEGFGRVGGIEVSEASEGWVMTNAIVFPWTGILVNGRAAAPADLATNNHFLAIRLPAGRSKLEWIWSPEPVWSALHPLSVAAYALVLLVTLVWIAVRILSPLLPAVKLRGP
jgi:hypothetical protein